MPLSPKLGLSPSTPKSVLIAVMGPTGSGKSSFINKVSGSSFPVGEDLESCTEVVETTKPFELDGSLVTLIDSPGFDDSSRTDTDILTAIAAHLTSSYERKEKLNGIIYIHRISDFRVGGIARQNFNMFQYLCGNDALQNVAIVTNVWGEVSTRVGEQREKQLATSDKLFKPALDNKARMFRHDDSVESAQAIIRHLIGKEPEALRIQKELVDEKLDIVETAAGMELNKTLLAQAEKHKEKMRGLEELMESAIKAKDEELTERLEDTRRQLQAKVDQVESDAANMAKIYQDERAALEERMKKMQADAEAERAKADEMIRTMQAEIAMSTDKLRQMEVDAEKERDRAAKNMLRLETEAAAERAKAREMMEAEAKGYREKTEALTRKMQKDMEADRARAEERVRKMQEDMAKERAQAEERIRTMHADANAERARAEGRVQQMQEEAAAERARAQRMWDEAEAKRVEAERRMRQMEMEEMRKRMEAEANAERRRHDDRVRLIAAQAEADAARIHENMRRMEAEVAAQRAEVERRRELEAEAARRRHEEDSGGDCTIM